MKQTGFTGTADIFGESREVEYRNNVLSVSGLTQHEARAVVSALETGHYGQALTVGSVVDAMARGLDKPALPAPPARTAAEVDAAGGRGVARESIEHKPSVIEHVPSAVPSEDVKPTTRAKRGAAAAPEAPAAKANGVNGHAAAAAPATEAPAVAPHVAVEYPGYAAAPDAERDAWVKLAAKELVDFRQNAPAYLDESWAYLLRTVPVGWFKRHLATTPGAKAAKASVAKEVAEKTAAAHRAVNEDVLAAATADVGSGKLAGAPVLSVAATAEIRAAFGINPGLLAPAFRQILVDAGVEDGLVPPALANDLDAAWPVLCEEAPAGWFKAQKHLAPVAESKPPAAPPATESKPAKAAKAAPPPAKDPGGLVDDGVDPDEDPIAPPAVQVAGVNLAEVQAQLSFRDVLSYLAEHGVRTQGDMLATCNALKKDVPTINRVADLVSRIPRALATLGIELPAS